MQNKLKSYRALLGINQTEMAKRIGISSTTYNLKETGKRKFFQDEMIAIISVVREVDPKVTLDDIFFE